MSKEVIGSLKAEGSGVDFCTWIRGRRSIRRFQPKPVPQPVIQQLLTAATWAPSAHNRQPWRFAIITELETKQRLAEAMGQKLRADLAADGLGIEEIDRDAGRSYKRMTTSPVLILMCLTMADMDAYPDPQRQKNEWLMAVQSVAMAGQNLLLAAHAIGLGACWLCAPLFCPDVVKQSLDMPDDWQPQGLVTLGYPASQPKKERKRLPLSSRVLFLDD